MRKRRPTHDADDAAEPPRTNTKEGGRSIRGNDAQPPPTKKQKLASEGEEEQRVLKTDGHTTFPGSRAGGELAASTNGLKHKDKSAVQPPSDGTVVGNGVAKSVRRKANQKLKVETKVHFDDHSYGKTTKSKSSSSSKQAADNIKRALRSHGGGSRSKSELAQYFPNFDEIINPDLKKKGILILVDFPEISANHDQSCCRPRQNCSLQMKKQKVRRMHLLFYLVRRGQELLALLRVHRPHTSKHVSQRLMI